MNNTIIRAVVVCVALFSGAVFADGVPLFTAGSALKAGDPILKSELTKQTGFVKIHPVVFNRSAFGANVITVDIDGTSYRFSGGMTSNAATMAPAEAALRKQRGENYRASQAWVGYTDDKKGQIVLTKAAEIITGTIDLAPARAFWFTSTRPVLVESDRNKQVSPAVISIDPTPPPLAASGVTK